MHTALDGRIVRSLDSNLHSPRVRPILWVRLGRLEQGLQPKSSTRRNNISRQWVHDRHIQSDSAPLRPGAILVKIDRIQALKVLILAIIRRRLKLRTIASHNRSRDLLWVHQALLRLRRLWRRLWRGSSLLLDWKALIEVIDVVGEVTLGWVGVRVGDFFYACVGHFV